MKFSRVLSGSVFLAILATHLAFAADATTTTTSDVGSPAPAATQAPENTSTVNEKVQIRQNAFDNLYADIFSTYHGPVLNNLGSANSVNNKGISSQKNPMYFDSELTTAYIVDKDSRSASVRMCRSGLLRSWAKASLSATSA